jgi:hypothetical protein
MKKGLKSAFNLIKKYWPCKKRKYTQRDDCNQIDGIKNYKNILVITHLNKRPKLKKRSSNKLDNSLLTISKLSNDNLFDMKKDSVAHLDFQKNPASSKSKNRFIIK